MTSKEAIEIARNVFQFENGEENDEWSRGVIKGLEQAEKDLEKIENFEKALGIDITVLQKLREDAWIVRDNGEKLQVIGIDFNTDDSLILYNEDNQEMFTSDLHLNDYGKTWALTKE